MVTEDGLNGICNSTEPLLVKETTSKGIKVKTYYFSAEKVGSNSGIQYPDNLIADAYWKSLTQVQTMNHATPEDLNSLLEQFNHRLKNDHAF
ncbi:hypothetical protein DVB69_10735 [Sporosarcina sp. BI001-red]|nr:hypothetical protein DVB69_10735 [Sporosarcina sp. BI001-red]